MSAFNKYLKKIVLVFMALQIFNLSIYNTDFYVHNPLKSPVTQVKDINPIDSFAELIIENIGGHNNAFPEPFRKNEKQSGEMVKHGISFKMIHLDHFAKIPEKETLHDAINDIPLSGFCNQYSFLYWKEINHPPA